MAMVLFKWTLAAFSVLYHLSHVAASSLPRQAHVRGPTPQFPAHSDTAPHCTWWWDNDGRIPCSAISDEYQISMGDFYRWNPSVERDCTKVRINWSYCVEVFSEAPTTVTTATQTTAIQTPTPTQPGMVANCDAFAFVEPGMVCGDVLSQNGITLQELAAWNPSVGKDCQSLWVNVYVCVSIVGHSPKPPGTTTVPPTRTTQGNGVQTPTPTQVGMVGNCKRFHFVQAGQGCQDVAMQYKIRLEDFTKWNPAVKADCSGLWSNTYACVGLI